MERPYQYVRGSSFSFDKEQWIEQRAQHDRIREGLIAVLSAVEPCSGMTVRGNRETKRLEPVHEQRKCLHFYHYYEDPIFGRCHVRVQSWYPFTVDVCVNGRAMLARQMDQHHLAYRKADNCFLDWANPQAAQELANAQWHLDWVAHLNRLLALAHPVYRQIVEPLYGLRYYRHHLWGSPARHPIPPVAAFETHRHGHAAAGRSQSGRQRPLPAWKLWPVLKALSPWEPRSSTSANRYGRLARRSDPTP